MTDLSAGVEVGDVDVANLVAFLLGGKLQEFRRDSGAAGAMFGGPGVLRRLLQSFQGDPCGGQYNLAIGATPTILTVPDEALSATFTVETTTVRVTFDGTIPTTNNGLLLALGGPYVLTGRASLQGAQFLQTGAGSKLQVAYFT